MRRRLASCDSNPKARDCSGLGAAAVRDSQIRPHHSDELTGDFGNATGVNFLVNALIAKQLEVLNETIIVTSGGTAFRRELIISLAARNRLPAVYPFRYYAKGGGLISYGPNSIDPSRRAAGYVDRILKGEKPANLPVQAPTKFELVINLKTAKALGLTIQVEELDHHYIRGKFDLQCA